MRVNAVSHCGASARKRHLKVAPTLPVPMTILDSRTRKGVFFKHRAPPPHAILAGVEGRVQIPRTAPMQVQRALLERPASTEVGLTLTSKHLRPESERAPGLFTLGGFRYLQDPPCQRDQQKRPAPGPRLIEGDHGANVSLLLATRPSHDEEPVALAVRDALPQPRPCLRSTWAPQPWPPDAEAPRTLPTRLAPRSPWPTACPGRS